MTEHRLTEALLREASRQELSEANPVAAMIVESTAATYPEQAAEVRAAGRFLCDLLRPGDSGTSKLSLPVVSHTYVREEHTTAAQMRAHLAQTTHRDLLLGLAAYALLAPRRHQGPRRPPDESWAVLRTVYLLVRMHEIQEETDALESALNV